MGISALSAGTGPAAAIIGGVALLLYGIGAGWYLIFGGIGLSVLWKLRFI
jgi:hypothetical protein